MSARRRPTVVTLPAYYAVYRLEDGVFEGVPTATSLPPTVNADTHGVLECTEAAKPDPQTDRWDGANGWRPATPEEVATAADRKVEQVVDRELRVASAAMHVALRRLPAWLTSLGGSPTDEQIAMELGAWRADVAALLKAGER